MVLEGRKSFIPRKVIYRAAAVVARFPMYRLDISQRG
jgi:hypothetical protein